MTAEVTAGVDSSCNTEILEGMAVGKGKKRKKGIKLYLLSSDDQTCFEGLQHYSRLPNDELDRQTKIPFVDQLSPNTKTSDDSAMPVTLVGTEAVVTDAVSGD